MKKYIDSFLHYRFLLWELIKKGIKLKYRRSYLGILWSLLEPLLSMIVLTIVFGTLLHKGKDKSFPVYVLTGRLLYGYFSSATKTALMSMNRNASMIKKIYVPKYLYTISAILYNYIIFLISLVVLVAVGAVLGVRPTLYMFQVIPSLLGLLIFTTGCCLILAVLGVFFRDLEHLWGVVLTLIMYTSAIMYTADKLLESRWWWILRYNPMFCAIDTFRSGVFGEPMNMSYFAYEIGFGIVTTVIGVIMFKKKQDEFILHL
ncbi:MAG: ABC transporter permease [Clostridiales bacterium]|nr:ABC transporter permease [Clostridiales bacterium]